MYDTARHVRILGCRGIPARHGGFETFCERFALDLVSRGYRVTVYCQEEGLNALYEDEWHGVRRVHISSRNDGAVGTILFDWAAMRHATREPGVAVVLGYGTGIFLGLHRWAGLRTAINMDGLESNRDKYGLLARLWLRINEYVACRSADRVIADHPLIGAHLSRHLWVAPKLRMIPYGASPPATDPRCLREIGVETENYYLVVARPEIDNQIAEIVRAFGADRRSSRLVILGDYGEGCSAYAKEVRAAAPDSVIFAGAIYDQGVVHTLRENCRAYLHGHSVGGTNPSLVESLAAGAPVLAHDNGFNRWVAGRGSLYFDDELQLRERLGQLDKMSSDELEPLRAASRGRFLEAFGWGDVLEAYSHLVEELVELDRSSKSTRPLPEAALEPTYRNNPVAVDGWVGRNV